MNVIKITFSVVFLIPRACNVSVEHVVWFFEFFELNVQTVDIPLCSINFVELVEIWMKMVFKCWVFISENHYFEREKFHSWFSWIENVPCSSVFHDSSKHHRWIYETPMIILSIFSIISSPVNIWALRELL